MEQKQSLIERKCERCGHTWIARILVSRVCPKCQSPYWDVPRKPKQGREGA